MPHSCWAHALQIEALTRLSTSVGQPILSETAHGLRTHGWRVAISLWILPRISLMTHQGG